MLRRFVVVRVHLHELAVGQVDVPDVEPLIGVRDLLRVGRPDRLVEERWRIAQRQLLELCPILRTQVQFVLTALVGKVCDPPAIGRPSGVALGGIRGVSQVSNIAMLRRHGQNLSVRFKRRAHAAGRDRVVGDVLADFLEVRTQTGQVAGDGELQLGILHRAKVELVKRPQLLVHDHVRRGGGPLDVGGRARDHRVYLLATRVVNEQ